METDRWDAGRQIILNAHPVPPRRAQREAHPPIPVRARLVWETDGEEWTDTTANAWTSRLVLVSVLDARHMTKGVWLSPSDVERR